MWHTIALTVLRASRVPLLEIVTSALLDVVLLILFAEEKECDGSINRQHGIFALRHDMDVKVEQGFTRC